MTDGVTNILVLSTLKIITVALGIVIVTLSWRVYRASRRKTFLWLTIGLGLMTVGAIAEGAAFQGLNFNLDQAHLVEAVFTLAAFAALVYSLYAKDERVEEPAGAAPHRGYDEFPEEG